MNTNFLSEKQILHISDVEVRETKMMGNTPIIIVAVRSDSLYGSIVLDFVFVAGRNDANASFLLNFYSSKHSRCTAYAMRMDQLKKVAR